MSRWRLPVRMLRITLTAVLWGMVATVVVVGGAARLAPLTGHELLAIRSGSMTPGLPVGAMVAVDRAGAAHPQPGDAVAFRLPSGHLVVHRYVEPAPDGTSLVTRGDANAAADPWPVPRDRLLGVVTWQLPAAGYLLGLLGMLSGVLAILAVAGALLCAIWLVEDLEAELRTELDVELGAERRRRADAPVHHETALGHPARRLR